ncbi:O-antigen ligase family protein [Luminiphilus sp.]|nr:O-antigen ligase family protein [Luminiphilus sp.]MDA8678455.1 O-antigen ligase family protein [Luminiphilus sp.]
MSESDSNHLTGRDWLWLGLICSFGLGSVVIQMAWVLALLGGYLFWRKEAVVTDPSLRQMWFWLGCLAVPALCSIFDSALMDRSIRTLLRMMSFGLVAVVLIQMPPTATGLKKITIGVALAIGFFCLDGIFQKVIGHNIIGNALWSDQFNPTRITGFLGLNYAWVLMVLSPWLFEGCRLLDGRGLAYWIAIPLLFVAVILGGSRASGVLLVISILTYATLIGVRLGVSASAKFVVPVFASLLGSVMMLAANPELGDRWLAVTGVFSGGAGDAPEILSWRPYLWDAAIALFLEHPINGVGMRAFGVSSETLLAGYGVADRLPGAAYNWSPHLSVLEVAADLGTIGLLGYAILLVTLFRWLINAPVPAIAPGLTALMALFPLGSTLSLFAPRVSAVAWISIAAALAFAKVATPSKQ